MRYYPRGKCGRNVLIISAAIALSALAGGCGLDYLDPFYAIDRAAKAKSDANMRADHEARQKAYQQEVDKERNRRQSYVDSPSRTDRTATSGYPERCYTDRHESGSGNRKLGRAGSSQ